MNYFIERDNSYLKYNLMGRDSDFSFPTSRQDEYGICLKM